MNVERDTVNCLDIFTQGSDQATVLVYILFVFPWKTDEGAYFLLELAFW